MKLIVRQKKLFKKLRTFERVNGESGKIWLRQLVFVQIEPFTPPRALVLLHCKTLTTVRKFHKKTVAVF